MRYPGDKGGSGVVQKIISLMPSHDRYIEPFLGGGIVLKTKRPAASTIAADIDPAVISHHLAAPMPGVDYRQADCFRLLPSLKLTAADLVYCDPPYHPETRTKKKIYRNELTPLDHALLCSLLLTLPARVMLSGYAHPLYSNILKHWHSYSFSAMTRGGLRRETVWMNFAPGASYHDTRFLGDSFRERERIKRKKDRWVSRFSALPAIDRAVISEALELAMRDRRSPTPAIGYLQC